MGIKKHIPFLLSSGFDKCLNLFHFRHYAQRTFSGGYDGCCCVCKGQHLSQLLLIQVVQTVFQDMVQAAAAEGVAGTGCLNGGILQERLHLYAQILVVSAASVSSQRQHDQRNIVLFTQLCDTCVEILFAGEPLDLVIGNL